VRLWDLKAAPVQTTLNHPGHLFLGFSPDGKHLISAGQQTRLWDLATLEAGSNLATEPLRLPFLPEKLAISPDGKLLASWEGTDVKLWELATGQRLATIPLKPGVKWAGLAFSPEAKTLAIGCYDGSLTLWDVPTQRVRAALQADRDRMQYMVFSPDGKLIAAGGEHGWVQIWDAASGQPKRTIFGSWGHTAAVSFSPDGKTLASGTDHGAISLWDVESAQLRASLKGHTAWIQCLAFFPDGKTLATSSHDRTIKLWDVATGQERVTLKGHESPLAIAPDGHMLASASEDGSVKLWQAATDPESTALKTDLDPDDPDSPVAQNNLGDRQRAAGLPKEAEAAYRQAMARLEKLVAAFPSVLEYRQELARSHEGLEQWDQAVADLSKVIELQPGKLDPLMKRAEFYTRRGRWEQAADDWKHAADDFAKTSEISPDQVVLAYRHALASLGASDLTGYRAICAAMLERFGQSKNSFDASWVAWTAVLAPAAVKDLNQVVQLAETAVHGDPKNYMYQDSLGAALYRSGRLGEAIKKLNEIAANTTPSRSSPAYTWFFLAMAHQQSGHPEEARQWLDKATKWMEQKIQKKDLPWNRQLTLQLLFREAEALLGMKEETTHYEDTKDTKAMP
jgi:tetratricopeptide (TPR) repeat protein